MAPQTGVILVVDDDKINRIMLSNQLMMEGHTVLTAASGREALEVLASQNVDLVLLDLVMPEIDGFQVLEYMKAHDTLQHLPVIIISALDEMGNVVRSIQMGATDHLHKPCDPFLLRARINTSLSNKRHREQQAEYQHYISQLSTILVQMQQGHFDSPIINELSKRSDSLGHLAQAIQQIAHELHSHEQAQHQQNLLISTILHKITNDIYYPLMHASFSLQTIHHYIDHQMFDALHEEIKNLDAQLHAEQQAISSLIRYSLHNEKSQSKLVPAASST